MSNDEFTTEWGVAWSLPEANGTDAAKTRAVAQRTVDSMKAAGHEARVVWRGITPWYEASNDTKIEATK